MSVVAMVMIALRAMKHLFGCHGDTSKNEATPTGATGDLAIQVYHLMQTAAFVVMATLIMRLKLFLSPQLAVLSGFLPALLKTTPISVSPSLPDPAPCVRLHSPL